MTNSTTRAAFMGLALLCTLACSGCELFDPSNNQYVYIPAQYGGKNISRLSERSFRFDVIPVTVAVEVFATKARDGIYDGEFQCDLTIQGMGMFVKDVAVGDVHFYAIDKATKQRTPLATSQIGQDQTSPDKSVRRRVSITGLDPDKHTVLEIALKVAVTDDKDKQSQTECETKLAPQLVKYAKTKP